MRIIYVAITMALMTLVCGSLMAEVSEEEVVESKVVSVSASTGTLTSSKTGTSYSYLWQSSGTDPVVSIECGGSANNMIYNGENLVCYVGGTAAGKTYTMKVTGKYYISKIEMDMMNNAAGKPVTVAIGDSTYTSSDELQHVEATYSEGDPVTMVFSGSNNGMLTQNFNITVSPMAGPVQGPVRTTDLVDGEFTDTTTWYTMRISANGLYIYDNEDAEYVLLNKALTAFPDGDQWCFVGNETDGYTVYNRAHGAKKMLAAPLEMKGTAGGSSYPVLKEPGDASYFYTWDLVPSTNISGTYYMTQHGNITNSINNRAGTLAFWTGGRDGGSSVDFSVCDQLFHMRPSEGIISLTGNRWMSWQLRPRIAVDGPGAQTVRTEGDSLILKGNGDYSIYPRDMQSVYLHTLEFDCETRSGNPEVTVAGGVTTKTGNHISVSGLTMEEQPVIKIAGEGEVALSNISMVFRREIIVSGGDVVFRYDVIPGTNIQYRIPAMTTVCSGKNEGRLVAISDYRYSGADIGSGRIDLYISHSDDNGATWTTPDLMRNSEGVAVSQGDNSTEITCGFGDAAIVSDRDSGKILVLSAAGRIGGFFKSLRATPQPTVCWYSEDGGDTWTEFSDITEQLYSLFDGEALYGYIDGEFVTSGRIMQSRFVKVADYYRIYMALACENDGGNTRNWVVYSDDFGKNWSVLGGIEAAPVVGDGDEAKIEELPDGSVFIAGRNRYGNRNFNIYRYTNPATAEGSWGTKVTTQLGLASTINACDGEIYMLPVKELKTGTKCYLMLQSVPFGPGRSNVGIVWKAIKGFSDYSSPQTLVEGWDGKFLITKVNSAYSTMTWQHNFTLGVLFEEATFGRDYSILYRNLTIPEITGGEYEYIPDPDNKIANGLTAEVQSIGGSNSGAVKWYDILGREVTKPVSGQLLIGSDGSKRIVK